MKIVLIILLILLCGLFCVFFIFNLPKKCPKRHKHSCYCNHSSFKEKKTGYKTVKKETTKKDKKGNVYKEIVNENVPYEYSIYSNTYICGSCGHKYFTTSHGREKTYNNYSEYRKKKRNFYIIGSSIFGLIFCLLLGSVIYISVSDKLESENNKLQTYINEKGDGKKYSYNTMVGDEYVTLELSYSEAGYDFGNNKHYRLYLVNYPTNNSHASSIDAALFFNLSSDKRDEYSLLMD